MTKRFSAEEDIFIKANLGSMTHKSIGENIGRTEQSVRNYCYRRGLVDNSDHWNQQEVDFLVSAYSSKFNCDINLPEIAKQLGRDKSNVCRKAKQLGLTDKNRKDLPFEQRKVRNKYSSISEAYASIGSATRQRIAKQGHPKGMLGKKHSDQTKAILSAASTVNNANRTPEQKVQFLIKSLRTKQKNGTYVSERTGTTWKAGWRVIGGERKYYRSRWEANYARYLEWLKSRSEISDWKHEPKTFWFEGVKRGCVSYLPDFWVQETSGAETYHEVKGWMDDRSKTKIRRMAKYHPEVRLIVIDSKAYESIKKSMAGLIEGWE